MKQSIEYLSRKGPIPNDLDALAGRVYSLFLDSDIHEIANEEGVLPLNSKEIESGMLSPCSVEVLLVLQVCDGRSPFQNALSAGYSFISVT